MSPGYDKLRETLIDSAIRLRVDEPLMKLRALASGTHRAAWEENQALRRLLEGWLMPTSNCIDIGAYNGRVLAAIVRLAPEGRHIAYEPLPGKHRLLTRRFPSVDVRHAAVSDHSGETTFTVVQDAPALSGLRNRWQGDGDHRTESLTVRVEALDTDLPPGYVPHFIKVDVEGAERQVFEGGLETLRRHRPTVLFEHGKGGAEHYGTEPHDVYTVLTEGAGLKIYEVEGDRPLSPAQFEDAYERNEQWNFVARP
jgi:FkbM family methyltransferase